MVAPNPKVGFHGCFQEKYLETANIAVLFVNPHYVILFGVILCNNKDAVRGPR